MTKKILVITVLTCLFLLASMISLTSAVQPRQTATANGAGVFVHEHEGMLHTHYFVFAVSSASDSPKGHFSLVCKHDGQIETIIFSKSIDSFSVSNIAGGLEAVFSGTAYVKMGTDDFTSGWTFFVTAIDFGRGSDQIGVTLINPQGQVHCSADTTLLTSGNINIKA